MASAAVMSNIAPCPISPAQLHQRRFHFGPKSSFTSMTGGRVASAPRGRRERPCDACRKRKSKCVVTEGQKRCAACAVHSQECTYVEEPQPRKRRMDSDGKESELSKRRYVHLSTMSYLRQDVDQPSKTIDRRYLRQLALQLLLQT